MSEASKSKAPEPASSSAGETSNNVPVDVGPILQSILGRSSERFGMAAVVLRGERIIAQGVAGVRKRGGAERITLADRFHLGSCTKAMTATLIAMLVEEGRLNWTTTLGELFAGTVKDLHTAWNNVTIRQVLAHRSGLRLMPEGQAGIVADLFLSSKLGRDVPGQTLPQQRLEIVKLALSRPPKFPPGTKFSYSNVGYVLAGAVLEHLTGLAWEDLMRQRLFQPLGITTGGFGAPGTPGKTDQPWGHSPILGKPLDPGHPSAELPLFYGPAGLAHMTITDWAKFIVLHLRGDPANPHRHAALLKPDTFAQMHPIPATPLFPAWMTRIITSFLLGDAAPVATYSAGWAIATADWAKVTRPGDTGRLLWHAGSNGRWNCVASMAPEIDFAVLVACNRGDIAILKTLKASKTLNRKFAPASP